VLKGEGSYSYSSRVTPFFKSRKEDFMLLQLDSHQGMVRIFLVSFNLLLVMVRGFK
jgi:hypothetical protein